MACLDLPGVWGVGLLLLAPRTLQVLAIRILRLLVTLQVTHSLLLDHGHWDRAPRRWLSIEMPSRMPIHRHRERTSMAYSHALNAFAICTLFLSISRLKYCTFACMHEVDHHFDMSYNEGMIVRARQQITQQTQVARQCHLSCALLPSGPGRPGVRTSAEARPLHPHRVPPTDH